MNLKLTLHLTDRLARWQQFLSGYQFEVQYIKGKDNRLPDLLSREPKLMHFSLVDISFMIRRNNMEKGAYERHMAARGRGRRGMPPRAAKGRK